MSIRMQLSWSNLNLYWLKNVPKFYACTIAIIRSNEMKQIEINRISYETFGSNFQLKSSVIIRFFGKNRKKIGKKIENCANCSQVYLMELIIFIYGLTGPN